MAKRSKTIPTELASIVTVLRETPLTRALHTAIRNKTADRRTFVRQSDRLVHLLLEEALGLLPSEECVVETPCGPYTGVRLPADADLCVVSILRAADCMLGVARALMPEVAVGKILIQRDEQTAQPKLFYCKLPSDIARRPVILCDPMLATGGSAVMAIGVLIDAGVPPASIFFVCVLCCPEGLQAVARAYPTVRVVTSAIDPILNSHKYIVPGLGDFGDRYFGTD
jgi:uracil phosphoribosyltransferase